MKTNVHVLLISLLLLSSCLKEDVEESADLERPAISANEGLATIQPDYFLTVAQDATEIPLAFTVTDDDGIQEIKIESHSGFDGHTHGKSSQRSNFIFFNHKEVIGEEDLKNSKQFTSTAAKGSKIYLDARNPAIGTNDLILAGPYHFSIQATDMAGNETSYQDNSTYHTTLFIHRPYAPQIELTTLDVEEKRITGKIYRNNKNEASSDIAFLWIYVETLNPENPGQEGEIVREYIWGSSNWPHQFRPDQGEKLPDTQQLELEELLSRNPEFFETLEGKKLVIWAEDTNGNISVNQFNK